MLTSQPNTYVAVTKGLVVRILWKMVESPLSR
jgi:hypothetical protein